ncbi:superoxide dismutase [Mn], mitochondrial-like isoform X4 [Carya illinoinensis]|uniref:superoxide dismutase [Mn], mitochondrial-like isoform X4 n=1 Tax=Carya illinoinensis TaxID=32201 RepID=UPI001C71DB6E|nr:superoxide dismutase [Mn], mitochondrial-like isoform X4 [Carya illinoinensis]XP_042948895.1 superoxide dismutase [Mn], mitochondrial-like isoform X4 [Carya illinoinensis]
MSKSTTRATKTPKSVMRPPRTEDIHLQEPSFASSSPSPWLILPPSSGFRAPSNLTAEGLGGEPPKPSLGSAIDTQYGSLDALIQKVNADAAALQGFGCKWLALDKERKQLSVETTADQDPLVTKGSALIPLIGIDVWAHACYLQDFGNSIPGHGGITDRMDCQISFDEVWIQQIPMIY